MTKKNDVSENQAQCAIPVVNHFYSAGDSVPYKWDDEKILHGKVNHTAIDKAGDKWLYVIDEENNHMFWYLEKEALAVANCG